MKLCIIGERDRLEEKLRSQIKRVEELTFNNTGLKLNIAFNYGGRWDIAQACQKVALEVEQGLLSSKDITPSHIQRYLSLADLSEPDFLIRTGGEQRISNFMLWQFAYTELYFSDKMWPEFNEIEFEKALAFYATRERRFGYTSEQLREKQHA